jgi:V/A-type H+-transporting ATPase subunit I
MSKLLLNRPEPLYKVEIVVPQSKSSYVLSRISYFGEIHLEKIEEKEVEELKKRIEETKNLLDMARFLAGKSGRKELSVNLTSMELESFSIEKVRKDLEPIYQKVSSLESRLVILEKKRKLLLELYSHIEFLPDSLNASLLLYRGRIYSAIMVVGKSDVISKTLELMKRYNIVALFLGSVNESYVYSIIYPSDFEKEIRDYLEASGLYRVPDELYDLISACTYVKELKTAVREQIAVVEKEISSLSQEIKSIAESNIDWIGKYLLYLDNLYAQQTELQKLLFLKHLSVMRGWVPKKSINDFRKELEKLQVPFYLTYTDPSPDDNPPSRLSNVKGIRNYEIITELYGTPSYWEWDPTPLVAYSFAFFFGLMVSDIAYSAIGILLIMLVLDKMVSDKDSPAYRKFKNVLVLSNIVALIFGIATGSLLGNFLQEYFNISLPVFVKYMLSPISFIKLSLIIGLIHINIAHALTLARASKKRDFTLMIQEAGIFLVQFFGIPLVLKMFFDYRMPILGKIPQNILIIGSLLSISLIIYSSIKMMRFLGLMTWIFQLTGLLGDVLSYVRLAGVGLATYYIALSFNFIVKMLLNWFTGTGNVILVIVGGVFSILLLALTHLISLILSLLGGFVHSLRLCFLEFLSKFYEGNGSPFSPLRVVLSRKIIIS